MNYFEFQPALFDLCYFVEALERLAMKMSVEST